MADSPASAPPGAAGERMSYEQFLTCYEGTQAEGVDGVVLPTSPVGREHQRLGRLLFTLLNEFVEAKGPGEMFYETFQMRRSGAGREPDLLFVASEYAERTRNAYLDGAADIVVEIMSPESRARDRGEKFYEHEQASMPEYWLIGPGRRSAEFYARDPQGVYRAIPLEGEAFRSTVLEGFWLRVSWLRELPPLRQVLAEPGLR